MGCYLIKIFTSEFSYYKYFLSLENPHECHTHTHTHPFNGSLSGTTRVSRYQKGKINLDFTEARYSKWQWNPLGHMQVCTSLQTDNHASTPPLSFLQAGCPSCRPTNSVKAHECHWVEYVLCICSLLIAVLCHCSWCKCCCVHVHVLLL